MADRLVDEIRDIEENREAFSSAVDLCENQLSESLRVLNESVRNVLYPPLCSFGSFLIVYSAERKGCKEGAWKCGNEEPRGE